MSELHELQPPTELTAEQREYWEQQLLNAERALNYALRMLGGIATEQGLER